MTGPITGNEFLDAALALIFGSGGIAMLIKKKGLININIGRKSNGGCHIDPDDYVKSKDCERNLEEIKADLKNGERRFKEIDSTLVELDKKQYKTLLGVQLLLKKENIDFPEV